MSSASGPPTLSATAAGTGTTKNQDSREVFITDALRHVPGALVDGKGADESVFTRKDGKPVKMFRGT